jgi:hypothetical protein
MRDIRTGSFVLLAALIFVFAFSANAQNKKSVKKPPTLKPAATGKAKAPPKNEAPKNEAAKTESNEKETAAPAASVAQADTVSGSGAKNPAFSANPKTKPAKTAKPKAREAAPEVTAAAKTDARSKAADPAAPVASPSGATENKRKAIEFIIAEKSNKKEKAAAAKPETKTEAPVKTAGKTAGKTAAKAGLKGAEKPVAKETTAKAAAPKTAKSKTSPANVSKTAKAVESKPSVARVIEKTKSHEGEPAENRPVEIRPLKESATKVIAKAPVKTVLPTVNAGRVRSDIAGKTIADVPSEEQGDGMMDWQFTANQTTDFEVLHTERNENEMVVDARVSAQKKHANLDGSFDRVRGNVRLYYQRPSEDAKNWKLYHLENVSLRHGDTSLDSPATRLTTTAPSTATANTAGIANAATANPAGIAPGPPVDIIPGGMSIDVGAGKYRSYSFHLDGNAIVTGRFQARGGAQNDIEAYILDADGFANWANEHGAPAYYNSGRLTVGAINTQLSAGNYYLVFSNRNSPADDKTVEAAIQLRGENNTISSTVATAGSDTVNTMRRTYFPSADPVPAYRRPAVPVNNANNSTTAATVRPQAQATPPQISQVAGYSSESVLTRTFSVGRGGIQAFPFTVRQGGFVKGNFQVLSSNSGDNNIEAFVMTADAYQRWAATHEGAADYSSGRTGYGSITRNLNPGEYYLVFNNRFAYRDDKTVQAELRVEYSPR